MGTSAGIVADRGTPSIRDIIDNRRLTAHFQQIVSVSRKKVTGLEGLIRGVQPGTGALIPPSRLFDAAREDGDDGLTLELDRACRETVIEAFSRIHRDDPEKILFLNLDASVLEHAVGSNFLYNQILSHGISPGNVVIEISEKRVQANAPLKRFVDTYREYGFMVALDDVGSGFSNMDRILLVRPDIIKVDISLVKNIHTDFYKQGVFKSLVILSNKIGALVIAEGVETEEEAVQVLRLGGHMIQGFFFSVPEAPRAGAEMFKNDKINVLSGRFNEYMRLQYQQERDKFKRLNRIVGATLKKLVGRRREEFDNALREIISKHRDMECAYILDDTGIQVSETVCGDCGARVPENLIFYSARCGTDHSMEKYYYPLMSAKQKKHTTEPYISLATGNLCVTVSALFTSLTDGSRYILCVDFRTAEEAYNIELRLPSHMHVGQQAGMPGLLSRMSEEMIRDSLTDSFNRRFMEERLLVDIFNAEAACQPLSVILTDIDRFKEVNDRYGHLAGDQVLKEFVKITKRFIRKDTDWIARYGGDEFVIVLTGADGVAAGIVAEKIRLACQEAVVWHGQQAIRFTVSFGTHSIQGENVTMEALIGTADRNLYTAKNRGRNQTVGF